MNKILLLSVLLALVACSPSEAAIQTAVAQTQAALPTATQTQIPTATENPCSDRGWADITTYLQAFNDATKAGGVGSSKAAYFAGMNNIKDKINEVDIDVCTEMYRQKIVSGVANIILSFQLAMNLESIDVWSKPMIEGDTMIADARDGLKTLGIDLNYP